MKIEIYDRSKKKAFLEAVSYLGDLKMNQLFIKSGSESVRIFSGGITTDELLKIWRNYPIEGVGLYFGKEFIDRHGKKESRLSLDGLHIIKEQITGNIVELNVSQTKKWFNGDNVEITDEQKEKFPFEGQFVAVKFKEDFIGTAKLSGKVLISFMPKERRVKNY